MDGGGKSFVKFHSFSMDWSWYIFINYFIPVNTFDFLLFLFDFCALQPLLVVTINFLNFFSLHFLMNMKGKAKLLPAKFKLFLQNFCISNKGSMGVHIWRSVAKCMFDLSVPKTIGVRTMYNRPWQEIKKWNLIHEVDIFWCHYMRPIRIRLEKNDFSKDLPFKKVHGHFWKADLLKNYLF